MFTHIMVGCNDLDESLPFYDATFAALEIPGQRMGDRAFYGNPDTGAFGVARPRDGGAATHANGGTIGLQAPSPKHIDAWHAAGLANGGTDEGAPGIRDLGAMKLYAAYLRDPVGNKLCAVTNNIDA